MDSNRHRCED